MRVLISGSPLGAVTSSFGDVSRYHPKPHTGIDLACPVNTPIHSPVDGVVDKLVYDHGNHTGLGNGIFIKSDSGYTFIFGHLNHQNVHVGELVHRGDLIGLTGSTGRSFGPHLHLAIKDRLGHYIDPALYKIKTVFMDLSDTISDLLV